jgi:Fe-S cluster assembly protein SufB
MNKLENTTNQSLESLVNKPYLYGFSTEIETEKIPFGLTEKTIHLISQKKKEPNFLLNFRLRAYSKWVKLTTPIWAKLVYPSIDYQKITYYSAPKTKSKIKSLDEIDPELLLTFEKLGISLNEQKRLNNVALDAVFDSVSIGVTFTKELAKFGIIFCPISEAVKLYPELVYLYLGKIVSMGDNYYSALNSAVFSDGSFCYIPKNTVCPMELSTYFRINDKESGQFERTLIVAEEGSSVSYLEGCTAPQYDQNQLHAAVVELVSLDNSKIKYSTVQNWFAGDENGVGGIYNFVTKRGLCVGKNAQISWTQVETGSAVTWKYPSCILIGNNSMGEFYSVALTNYYQQADTGTKMIHIGKNTKSKIISKGISAGNSSNTYRGLVKVLANADNSRNYSQCDSLLIKNSSNANTFPYIYSQNSTSKIEHEASTSKIGEEQLFYFAQRGIDIEDAVSLMINGFCQTVFNKLPMEFAVEADRLLSLKLEGTIG